MSTGLSGLLIGGSEAVRQLPRVELNAPATGAVLLRRDNGQARSPTVPHGAAQQTSHPLILSQEHPMTGLLQCFFSVVRSYRGALRDLRADEANWR